MIADRVEEGRHPDPARHLAENKVAIASQVIAATIEVGLIKADERVGGSRKFARYLPFWA